MAYAWIERESANGSERHELARGLTRIGGARADVPMADAADDELQLWDDPPKLVHLGGEPHPVVNGRESTEASLVPGDVIEWRGARFVFRAVARRAALALEEEAPVASKPQRASGPPTSSDPEADELDRRAGRRLLAARAVEQRLVDEAQSRRWRELLGSPAFDADRCADELLCARGVDAPVRLLERSSAELREHLAPVRASASPRTARERPAETPSSPRDTFWRLAFALALLAAVAALLLWARAARGVSLDAWIDRALGD